jgi:diaminopimelate decarboxylase
MIASVPAAFDTTAEGHLEIDGCDVVDLVAEHGAPLWVISEATIRANYRRLRDAFRRVYPATTVLYATKANPEPAIIRVALLEGAMVDAVTLGHMRLIERAGGRPEQIVFNGNSKTEAELRFALDGRIGVINVDSLAEMQLIAELAPTPAGDRRQPVCLRVAFDNTRVTGDDAELAGYEHLGKFGMGAADLLAAAEIARSHPGIELAGLHNHLGYPGYGETYSPELDLQRHVAYLTQTLEVARTLRDHGDVLRILNVGGGYRVGNPAGFGPGQPTEFPTADDYAEAIAGCARDLCAEWRLGSPELILEAGGYLVSDAVALIARLGGSKTRRAGAEQRSWTFLEDTSSYHFVRRTMYGFHHQVVVASRMHDRPDGPVSIAGPVCTDDDVAIDAPLPRLRRGDLLAVLDNGSYCEAITTDYCAVPIPAAVMVSAGRSALTRKRETVDDLVARFDVPTWLERPA